MDETIKQVDDVLWKELALEVVDQASKSDEVTDRPDVLLILEGVRARILRGQKELVEIFPEDTGDPVIEQIRQEISMMMDAGKDMAQEEEMMTREILGVGRALPDESMIGRNREDLKCDLMEIL